ncbi:DinB family protein [Brevibacillus ginsengisoli]|uniref:DinB family protein n=1 Tax=Brevibacillus ginsengisoli TaxID=363854 RepID=UPI003CF7AE7E
MSQVDFLLEQLSFTYDQEDWYPPLKPALEGVTAEIASWRPAGAAVNSIWETVNHLLYYKERLIQRIHGVDPTNPAANNDETFSSQAETLDEAAWQATLNRVDHVYQELKNQVSTLSEDDLDRPSPSQPLRKQIMSIINHDAYHIGEIIQIRKLHGSWPARRYFD